MQGTVYPSKIKIVPTIINLYYLLYALILFFYLFYISSGVRCMKISRKKKLSANSWGPCSSSPPGITPPALLVIIFVCERNGKLRKKVMVVLIDGQDS